MNRQRNLRYGLVGVLISGATIAFIASQIQLDAFGRALREANYLYVLPCIVFLVLGLVARAQRWRSLLAAPLPFERVFSIMNVAYLVNGVLPLRLGEVVRVFLMAQLGQDRVPAMRVVSSIVVERLLDLLSVVLMVFVAIVFAPVPDQLRAASLVSAALVIVGFIVLIVASRRRAILYRVQDVAARVIPLLGRPRLRQWLDQFLDGIAPLTSPLRALRLVGWTALSWGLSIVAGYFLMVAVFGSGDWLATALYIAAAAFAIAVPAVPGNLGTYEWSIVVALQALGYSDFNQLAAFAVLVHAVNVLVHAVTGLIGMAREGITLSQIQRGVQQMRRVEG